MEEGTFYQGFVGRYDGWYICNLPCDANFLGLMLTQGLVVMGKFPLYPVFTNALSDWSEGG